MSERACILNDLPALSDELRFSDLMAKVNEQPFNAKIFFNRSSGKLEIFPQGGGWLGAKSADLEADIAPFAD